MKVKRTDPKMKEYGVTYLFIMASKTQTGHILTCLCTFV